MLKIVLKNSSVYAIPTLLSSMVGFFMLPIYTRVLTPTDYGILETVTKITDVCGLLLGAGVADAVLRFYSAANQQEEKDGLVWASVIVLIIANLIGIMFFLIFCRPLSVFFLNSDSGLLLLLSFVSVAFGLMLRVPMSLYIAESKPWRYAIVSIGFLFSQIILNVVALFVFNLGVLGMVLGSLFSAVTWSLVTMLSIIRRKMPDDVSRWYPKLLGYGMPLLLASVSQFVLNFSDRFFLARFTTMESIGLYSVAYRIGMLVTTALAIIGRSWWPLIFKSASLDGSEKEIIRLNTIMYYLCSWVCVTVILFSKPVIQIMTTPQYISAYKYVPPIAIAYFSFCLVNGPLCVVFKVKNMTTVIAKVNIVTAVVCLFFSFLLIPLYGIWGAIWVTLVCYVFQLITFMVLSHRFWVEIFDLRAFVIAILGVIVSTYIAYNVSNENFWLFTVPAWVFIGSLYIKLLLNSHSDHIFYRICCKKY